MVQRRRLVVAGEGNKGGGGGGWESPIFSEFWNSLLIEWLANFANALIASIRKVDVVRN